ncbi:MAG: glucans biosynthesis glucosyltransferase MdoH, partial [Pseudomonadota bacterium]
VLRDRRWCQGNLQHLRLLFAAGLHPLSRFHLLQGAMAYLTSLAWFTLLLLWAGFSAREAPLVRYFSPENPLFPMWPDIDLVSRVLVLCFVYAMLVAPKVLGVVGTLIDDPTLRSVGGPVRFVGSTLLELLISIALAPIMMVQQVRAVLRTFAGVEAGWAPQRRAGERDGWRTLLAFHWLETALGLLLVAGLATDQISAWIAPIAISLALSVPISALMQTQALPRWLGTPETYAPPAVETAMNRALGRDQARDTAPVSTRPARSRLWRPRRV